MKNYTETYNTIELVATKPENVKLRLFGKQDTRNRSKYNLMIYHIFTLDFRFIKNNI